MDGEKEGDGICGREDGPGWIDVIGVVRGGDALIAEER